MSQLAIAMHIFKPSPLNVFRLSGHDVLFQRSHIIRYMCQTIIDIQRFAIETWFGNIGFTVV